jgi:hypothetical protein
MSSNAWLFIGMLTTLGALIIRFAVPLALKAKVRRTGQVVGSDEPERPTVAAEILPPPPSQALRQKDVHDEHIVEAIRLLKLARARDSESLFNLATADERLAEALLLRPDGFESTRLQADIAIARAGFVGPDEKVAAFERAAERFSAALSLRKGIPDLYIGLGWSWLGVMRHDESKADAPIQALAAFTAGHETSRGNLWLIKGWGTTVDVMVRRGHPQSAAALAQYETALNGLSGPAAMARSWFDEVRSGAEATWLPVPPLRDA